MNTDAQRQIDTEAARVRFALAYQANGQCIVCDRSIAPEELPRALFVQASGRLAHEGACSIAALKRAFVFARGLKGRRAFRSGR
jgi:hypothetical protein